MTFDVTGSVYRPDGTPVSYDGLQNTKFNLIFQKASNSVIFLQAFEIPGVSVNEVDVPTPFVNMNEIGEKLNFGQFNITFLIDSEFKNYKEIFDWMKRMTVAGSAIGDTDDVVIIINDKQSIRFYGCWPMSMSNVSFITNATDVEYLTCSVVMNFDYFEFI